MLIRSVVHHQVDQHAQSTLPAAVGKLHKVSQGAIARIDPVVVRYVVAIISAGRRLKGHEPYGSDTQPLQVVQTPHEPLEVANAISVGIQVGGDRQAINDRVLIPKVVDHAGSLSGWKEVQ